MHDNFFYLFRRFASYLLIDHARSIKPSWNWIPWCNVHGKQQWGLLLLNLIRWSTGQEETWLPNGEWHLHYFFVSTLQEPGQGGLVVLHGWFMEDVRSLCHLIGSAWTLEVINTRRPRWRQPQRLTHQSSSTSKSTNLSQTLFSLEENFCCHQF